MPGSKYSYYRNRKIKRAILLIFLFIIAVIIAAVFICNTDKNGTVNDGIKSKEINKLDRAESPLTTKDNDEETGDIKNTGGKQANKRTQRRKKAAIVNPATKPAAIEKVKKTEPEKRLPPKSPTIEIIGSDGNVLMKKE